MTSSSRTSSSKASSSRASITRGWDAASITFLILSVIGLIGTLAFNVLAVAQHRNYFGDWFASGPAVNSLGVDLLIVAVAGSVFIVLEARRLKMRGAWIYLVLSAVTAFAFTFPLFLAMRARRLAMLSTA